jgi:mRNA interferase RelE/StbE
MRQVDLTRDAKEFIEDLQAKQFKQVVQKIFGLLTNPEPADSALLRGYDYRRADIGEYRIIYEFDETTLYIVLVGKRNDDEVYKQLKRKE